MALSPTAANCTDCTAFCRNETNVTDTFVTLVTGCSVTSFLGFFGSVYVLLSSIGVVVRLKAQLRHQLWHYLLNGGFLIVLLAIGEGMLGALIYKASMNAAMYVDTRGFMRCLVCCPQ